MKTIITILAGALVLAGCSEPPQSKPTNDEVKSFVGKPLTPDQVAKMRGSLGGGDKSIPGPKTGTN